MRNYEQELFDALTKLHDNLQYCMVTIYENYWKGYKFVNSAPISTEYWYYDGYEGIEFTIDNIKFFMCDETFAVWDKNNELHDPVFEHIKDIELDIIDKNSYFQCSLIENLQGIRWELFPIIKKIRSTFFDGISTKDYLDNGFKFI